MLQFLFVCMFVCLFVYEITQFVLLAGIQLAIQHSSKYLFGFLIICPDFTLTDCARVFEGMSILRGTSVFRDVISLGSIIFS